MNETKPFPLNELGDQSGNGGDSHQNQDFLITLNSREYAVDGPVVTYEQVVSLEFQYPPANPNIVYSMTYRHAASKPHAGELAAGGSVTVKKKGTVFNVTATDKS